MSSRAGASKGRSASSVTGTTSSGSSAGVDLLLLTSEAEGIPGVAIEALMAGCPVVTVPVGSVAEVVEDGVTGVVMATADPAAMAAAVVSLLDDGAASGPA